MARAAVRAGHREGRGPVGFSSAAGKHESESHSAVNTASFHPTAPALAARIGRLCSLAGTLRAADSTPKRKPNASASGSQCYVGLGELNGAPPEARR